MSRSVGPHGNLTGVGYARDTTISFHDRGHSSRRQRRIGAGPRWRWWRWRRRWRRSRWRCGRLVGHNRRIRRYRYERIWHVTDQPVGFSIRSRHHGREPVSARHGSDQPVVRRDAEHRTRRRAGPAMRPDGRNEPGRAGPLHHRQRGAGFDGHEPQPGARHGGVANRRLSEPQQHDGLGELLRRRLLAVRAYGKRNGARRRAVRMPLSGVSAPIPASPDRAPRASAGTSARPSAASSGGSSACIPTGSPAPD